MPGLGASDNRVVLNEDGGWCWFEDPRVVLDGASWWSALWPMAARTKPGGEILRWSAMTWRAASPSAAPCTRTFRRTITLPRLCSSARTVDGWRSIACTAQKTKFTTAFPSARMMPPNGSRNACLCPAPPRVLLIQIPFCSAGKTRAGAVSTISFAATMIAGSHPGCSQMTWAKTGKPAAC